MRNVAELVGYNKDNETVYQETIPLSAYWDGEHPWDKTEVILKLGLTLLKGKLYESEGSVFQEFETAFSSETGEYVGSKGTHADGTVNVDGVYDVPG